MGNGARRHRFESDQMDSGALITIASDGRQMSHARKGLRTEDRFSLR